ncbi:shikimate dehydrogenase [Lysobacter sp. HDW10]|uniref:shikimate dehydrogenase n=1 Tax=Lysobacter sp. HDW10 TaxID=2714936 RepID=UPI00140CA2B5|nr:shikimate dehydrogenase [Lysobacter sp. HDW10]QIK80933.1 shikimate dehydrogenase [Lysobacter sp. HDW10]
MTAHFAVFGHPVAHSLSPRIHELFAAQCNIALAYSTTDTSTRGFKDSFETFIALGGVGANVTAPDKAAAFEFCTRHTHRALRAKSVNTLFQRNGEWQGDTTDGSGLLRDLRERLAVDLHDARVLLIGAGGAANAVAPALLDAGVSQLMVANRTRARAYDLIDALADENRTRACTIEELPSQGMFDLVVFAAAPADSAQCDAWPISMVSEGTTFIDLNYGARALPTLTWAAKAGVTRLSDGLGMLVEQAADSFEIWHGVRPETADVYAALR